MTTPLPLPPPELRFMAEDDELFLSIGDRIVLDMIELCALRGNASVLDVGSGYGRVAHGLWRREFEGSYLGLEILQRHVTWCQDAITPASGGRLRFAHLDVRNDRYNPGGALLAEEATFDVADASVDVAVLTSVFTHMYPAEIVRYTGEIHRVLRPGGRALATFFALDETWREAQLAGRGELQMPYVLDASCRYHSAEDPLHAIAYTTSWIRATTAAAGLRVYAARLGFWCDRPAAHDFLQDAFVLERPA
jgi:SAM-dependent methyltransferase